MRSFQTVNALTHERSIFPSSKSIFFIYKSNNVYRLPIQTKHIVELVKSLCGNNSELLCEKNAITSFCVYEDFDTL